MSRDNFGGRGVRVQARRAEVVDLRRLRALSDPAADGFWPFAATFGKFWAVSASLFTLRFSGWSQGLLLILLALGACKAPPRHKGPRDQPPKDNLPVLLRDFAFVESFRGTPSAIGCSDGQREGFADLSRFPNIAGCVGAWQGRKKLTADRAGGACGDDAQACVSPADLCAPGWHLCSKDGDAGDLKTRVSAKACEKEAGPGRFVAAMSHGQVARICPPPPGPHTRFPCMERGVCAEPVCCGDACAFGACRDAVWPGKTRISRASPNGCGSALSRFHGGVLCCRDQNIASISAADVQGDLKLGTPPQKPAPEKPEPGSSGKPSGTAPSPKQGAIAPKREPGQVPPPVKPKALPSKAPVNQSLEPSPSKPRQSQAAK